MATRDPVLSGMLDRRQKRIEAMKEAGDELRQAATAMLEEIDAQGFKLLARVERQRLQDAIAAYLRTE